MTLRFKDELEFKQFVGRGLAAQSAVDQLTKVNKYNVAPKVKRTVDGKLFASKKEADFYVIYRDMWRRGEIHFFLCQVPFSLPGNVTYRLDFMIFRLDGEVEYVDAKGKRTAMYIMKKKQVEALYPITIKEV